MITENEKIERLKNGESFGQIVFDTGLEPTFRPFEIVWLTPIKSIDHINVGDFIYCRSEEHYFNNQTFEMVTYYLNKMRIVVSKDVENGFSLGTSDGTVEGGYTKEIYAKINKATPEQIEQFKIANPELLTHIKE
jgi:hypothetical protein